MLWGGAMASGWAALAVATAMRDAAASAFREYFNQVFQNLGGCFQAESFELLAQLTTQICSLLNGQLVFMVHTFFSIFFCWPGGWQRHAQRRTQFSASARALNDRIVIAIVCFCDDGPARIDQHHRKQQITPTHLHSLNIP